MRDEHAGTRRGRPPLDGGDGRATSREALSDRADLVEKYRRVVEKYEELVRRYSDAAASRSSAATLASAALRATRSGLGLVAGTGFHARNARWFELAAGPGPWRWRSGEGRARELDRIEDAVWAAGAELLADRAGSLRVERFERTQPPRIVDVRLERVDVHGRRLVTAIADDVTERVLHEREAEQARSALLESERMRLVGELASGVAHDLNNTLHAMALRIGHVLRMERLDPEAREHVALLARIVSDAATRVGQIQEFGRRREDVPSESLDVAEIVAEAIAIAHPEFAKGGQLGGPAVEIVADVPAARVVGSAAELRHVFVNLLVNARDAMPSGGRISVRGRVEGGAAQVRVEDEGRGIAPEHLDRVFDPFFTTKGRGGTGLGLAIAHGVMRRLGGRIEAQNRPGGGAAIVLTFPLAPAHSPGPAPGPPRPPAGRHRLLVVDDDRDNLEASRLVLEELGQQVDVAPSGEEALRLVEERPGYELVLCDLGMPGMNGWQVAERIRRASPRTQVLLLTGWAHEIRPDDARLAAVDGLLPKPLDVDRLRDLIADTFGGPARTGAEAPSPETPRE